MATKKELIQFVLQNSSDCDFNLELFQQNIFSVNATTKYSWNITTQDLSCSTGTIVINGVTINLTYEASITGLVSALNALGYGFFCSETLGGQTYIYTVDDTNVYGNLTLCDQGLTTTTTTTTSTTVSPTTTTTSTTSTTTVAPVTTTTTTTTTTSAPVTTTTTTTTTTVAPVTTTTTTTTTTAGFVEYTITSNSYADSPLACSGYDTDPNTTVYTNDNGAPDTVTRFYTDFGITPFAGDGDFYAWEQASNPGAGRGTGTVSPAGFTGTLSLCP